MNIGFVSLDYPSARGGGGVGTLVQTLARDLVEKGHKVTVLALRAGKEEAENDDAGVRVMRFPQGNIHWYLLKLPFIGPLLTLSVRELERAWKAWRMIGKASKEEPFDIIEVTEQAGLFIMIFTRRTPVVARLHGEYYTFVKYTPDLSLDAGIRLSRVIQRVALRRAARLISPSKAHGREIAEELGTDCPPIEVIPNTVKFRDMRQDLSLTENVCDSELLTGDAPIVLHVGRVERRKGIPILLEAARQVLDEYPGIRFVLAGANHPTLPKDELDSLVSKFALSGKVHFLGHIPRREIYAWYRRATLCVMPSYYESFGISALEPMLFGVPIVATTAGALPEVVEDGITGLLVPPGNPKALAGAILGLLKNASFRSEMSRSMSPERLAEYSVDSVANRTLKLYEELIRVS